MKKLLALILVIAVGMGLLTACVDNLPPETETGNDATAPSVDYEELGLEAVKEKGPDKIADGAVLKLWVLDQPTCVTDYSQNLMTRWFEAKTGVKLEWTVVPQSGFQDKFTTSIASGTYPDIYNSYLTTTEMALYGGPNGIFVAIDDLIDQGWMPNLKAYIEANPIFNGLRSEDGKLYGIPTYSSAPHMLFQKKVWVNKTWLEQYIADGGKSPDTTEEFEQMLIYFRDHDMNDNGDTTDEVPMSGCQQSGWGTDPTCWLMCPFALVNGEGQDAQFLVADEDGNISWVGGTDAYREGLRWAHGLVEQGLLDKAIYTQDTGLYKAMVTDNIVGVVAGAEEAQFCLDSTQYDNWVALAPLEGPTGLRQVAVYSREYSTVSYSVAITRSCQNLEVAAKWLDYFFTEEGSRVAAFGFEGFNYDYSDTAALDGTTPSILRYPDTEANINTRWGHMVAPSMDLSLKESASEGTSVRLQQAAKIYEPYLTETGIPLVAFPLSEEEERAKSEAFDWVVLQTYYKSFRFVTGQKDKDLANREPLDINNDEHWQNYLNWINTDGMLDEYIRLNEKKFFPDKQ